MTTSHFVPSAPPSLAPVAAGVSSSAIISVPAAIRVGPALAASIRGPSIAAAEDVAVSTRGPSSTLGDVAFLGPRGSSSTAFGDTTFLSPRGSSSSIVDLTGRTPSENLSTSTEPLSLGKSGAMSSEEAYQEQQEALRKKLKRKEQEESKKKVDWKRVLKFAAMWAVIVALVVGIISFLFSPLLTQSDTGSDNPEPLFQWKLPLYNAVLSGTLTFSLTVALALTPRE